MSRAGVLEVLAQRMGLEAASLGERIVDHTLADVRRDLRCENDAQLLQRINADPAAVSQLIEHFLVPESWFLRGGEQFQDLARHARQSTSRPYRVLCLPCARGEEVYSAALTLVEAGLDPAAIEVVGVDLSPTFVAAAREGWYPETVFRRGDPGARWFEPVDAGRRVAPVLRRCVRFVADNALSSLLLADEAPFDAIFCRNLLIYLHRDARRQVLDNLLRLSHGKTLFLAGQAENLALMNPALRPVRGYLSPLTFGCAEPLRTDPVESALTARPSQASASRLPPSGLTNTVRAAPRGEVDVARPTRQILGAESSAQQTGVLDAVRALADSGGHAAALAAVIDYLAATPFDAEGHFLKGILEMASGKAALADASFRQALYLDPDHEAAMQHRLALAASQGDATEVRRLQGRLRSGRVGGKR